MTEVEIATQIKNILTRLEILESKINSNPQVPTCKTRSTPFDPMVHVTYTDSGEYSISGNTYPIKDYIKSLRGKFQSADKSWLVPSDTGFKKSLIQKNAEKVDIDIDFIGFENSKKKSKKCKVKTKEDCIIDSDSD